MSKIEKLIKKLRDSQRFKSINFDENDSLLTEKLGYKRSKKGTGSHFTYINIDYDDCLPVHLKRITVVRWHGKNSSMSRRTRYTVLAAYDVLKIKGLIK
ncbi:hypothetical protein KAU33_01400 [Candidatus Dependentiae bacterium]|nr:hypothetical protein [Candidatus Dependentiae bacterium]